MHSLNPGPRPQRRRCLANDRVPDIGPLELCLAEQNYPDLLRRPYPEDGADSGLWKLWGRDQPNHHLYLRRVWEPQQRLVPGLANPSFTYDYTGRNQLKNMLDSASANVVSYTYDDSGNMLSRTPESNPASSFAYDAINRVTQITHNFTGGVSKTIN